jgi:hypothetical protein
MASKSISRKVAEQKHILISTEVSEDKEYKREFWYIPKSRRELMTESRRMIQGNNMKEVNTEADESMEVIFHE